jgi:hypothetical protein
MRKVLVAAALAIASFGVTIPAAGAHGGGLDQNGGHYCRDAGYRSGKCGPRNSYHCHRSYCRRR